MERQVILTACIAYFALTIGTVCNQDVNQAVPSHTDRGNKVRENFQNLFNSIANNNARNGDHYREILRNRVTREQETFDTMNEELRTSRNKNTAKNQNTRVAERVVARKRETDTCPSTGLYVLDEFVYHDYTFDRFTLEEWFKNMHPDLDNLHKATWKECENLNMKSLADVCFQLINGLNSTKQALRMDEYYTYVEPAGDKAVKEEHILRNAPMKFWQSMHYNFSTTLIRCPYKERDAYMAEGNGTHVFRVENDPRDGRFYIKTGLHPIVFPNT